MLLLLRITETEENFVLVYRELEANSSTVTSSLLLNKSQAQLVDFDNHLDDASKNWSNEFVAKLIESAS